LGEPAQDMSPIVEFIGIGPHKVLESSPSGAVAVRPDGTIAWANLEAVAFFGYARAEFVGQHVNILLPEDRRDSHADYVAEWIKHPRARAMGAGHLNIQGRNKSGELLNLDIQLSPIETAQGILALAWIRERSS
jgi:PAS domain S-box-containing protein